MYLLLFERYRKKTSLWIIPYTLVYILKKNVEELIHKCKNNWVIEKNIGQGRKKSGFGHKDFWLISREDFITCYYSFQFQTKWNIYTMRFWQTVMYCYGEEKNRFITEPQSVWFFIWLCCNFCFKYSYFSSFFLQYFLNQWLIICTYYLLILFKKFISHLQCRLRISICINIYDYYI